MMVPSMTACGSCRKRTWSLQVPGSLSSPLTRTYLGLSDCLGTNDHFHAGGKACSAAAAQAGGLHRIDDALGAEVERHPRRLIAVELEVLVDVGGALAEAALEDNDFLGMGDGGGHYFTSFP